MSIPGSNLESKLVNDRTVIYDVELNVPAPNEAEMTRIINNLASVKNVSDKEKKEIAHSNVVNLNFWKEIKKYMYKFFHVNYSTSEIKAKSDQLKKQHPDAIVESNTDRVLSDFIKDKIYDTLIYEHFVNVFKINITDEEVRRFLQDYYEKTNTSIQSILNDPKQTSRIKNELTFAKLLREFSEKFRVKYLG